jgi:hypothetical protein
MNDAQRFSNTDNILDNLAARDVAALYLGQRQLLLHLQDFQQSGKRVTGGLSARIEIAAGMLSSFEAALERLGSRDPQKLADVLDYLQFSPRSMQAVIDRLRSTLVP